MAIKGNLEKKNDVVIKEEKDITRPAIIALIGVVLMLTSEEINEFIGIAVGACILLIGIYTIYKYTFKKVGTALDLACGILYTVLGVIIISNPFSVLNLVAKCLGVYLAIGGFLKLKDALSIKDTNDKWKLTLAISIITLAFGTFLIVSPVAGVTLTNIAGAFLAIYAIFDILDMYMIRK